MERKLFMIGGYVKAGPLFDWWLGLAGKKLPTVCYIPTAGGDSYDEIAGFYHRVVPHCGGIKVLKLFNREVVDVDAFLADVDIVYVGGGNTANMLAIWRAHGVDKALRQAYDRGVIVGGMSAGAIAFANGGTTDSFGPLAVLPKTLAFVERSVSPHHEAPGRMKLFETAISVGQIPIGYGLENGTGVLFKDGKLAQAVSESSYASVWITHPGLTERLPTKQL